jgi:hypothetical protein
MHGWTAGIGLEALLSNSWTGRIEYRYADYGNVNDLMTATIRDPRRAEFESAKLAKRLRRQVGQFSSWAYECTFSTSKRPVYAATHSTLFS